MITVDSVQFVRVCSLLTCNRLSHPRFNRPIPITGAIIFGRQNERCRSRCEGRIRLYPSTSPYSCNYPKLSPLSDFAGEDEAYARSIQTSEHIGRHVYTHRFTGTTSFPFGVDYTSVRRYLVCTRYAGVNNLTGEICHIESHVVVCCGQHVQERIVRDCKVVCE